MKQIYGFTRIILKRLSDSIYYLSKRKKKKNKTFAQGLLLHISHENNNIIKILRPQKDATSDLVLLGLKSYFGQLLL